MLISDILPAELVCPPFISVDATAARPFEKRQLPIGLALLDCNVAAEAAEATVVQLFLPGRHRGGTRE